MFIYYPIVEFPNDHSEYDMLSIALLFVWWIKNTIGFVITSDHNHNNMWMLRPIVTRQQSRMVAPCYNANRRKAFLFMSTAASDPPTKNSSEKTGGGRILKDIPPQFVVEEQQQVAVKSTPVEGGNWNVEDPVGWTRHFGRRSPSYDKEVKALAVDANSMDFVNSTNLPGVTVVDTVEKARAVMEILMNSPPDTFHACDTEVMDIDLKTVGPVGNGYVTCLSVYSGPDFDYGDGPLLWVDNLDGAADILMEFKDFLESKQHLKIWHNYGFDRHVLWNEGIDVQGLGADTLHMARLYDTSRLTTAGGYSLEALTDTLLNRRKRPMKELFGKGKLKQDGTPGNVIELPPMEDIQRSPSLRDKWIQYSCYDAQGTWMLHQHLQEKLSEIPWQTKDHSLYQYYFTYMREFCTVLTDMERRGIYVDKEYLAKVEEQARADRAHHVQVFQDWAIKHLGPVNGLAMNPASSTQLQTFFFGGSQNKITKERTELTKTFKIPTSDLSEAALQEYRKLWHGDSDTSDEEEDDELMQMMNVAQLKALCKEYGLKVSGKKSELQQRLRGYFLSTKSTSTTTEELKELEGMSEDDLRDACVGRMLSGEGSKSVLLSRLQEDIAFQLELLSHNNQKGEETNYQSVTRALEEAAANNSTSTLSGIWDEIQEKKRADPKYVELTISSLQMEPSKFTAGGAPSVTADVLRKLAGKDPANGQYGTAYEFFSSPEQGHDACMALYSLTSIGSIDTMIANFLTSLQALADDEYSRVHGSININTETGRLSSRRPNLQNQPALEKDVYGIRKAFQASPGNKLIVADYGQLELRLLASMTNCISMVDAFEAGGDFHSRTALGMFDYIQKKVESGDCLLEWDYPDGKPPPKPLLKDEFASERRKAKTLNFSIAYGKTAHGLSQDWGVSIKEAEDMLQAWYNSRPEVLKWQTKTKAMARKHGITKTLMGRYRHLPGALEGKRNRKALGHAERASINTPIQGGAADVAMMAMIKINKSPKLKKLGWVLLMQIHDEVILEGPEETAEEAFEEVLQCMQHPWVYGLPQTSVPLLVDGSYKHTNWYDAK